MTLRWCFFSHSPALIPSISLAAFTFTAPAVFSHSLLLCFINFQYSLHCGTIAVPTNQDAPGYDQRILFPIDLSLVRKMITSRVVSSFADLHIRIGMICHNCMKYNGRESDYGVVTRDFEAMVDDLILQAVYNEIKKSAAKS
mmetsp:Transcript_20332/g.56627  ORF Transcript_20332/g.56627 Transcript_20332/m.56627 type:complete len:142 (-) Transcript_20332:223-648(-)